MMSIIISILDLIMCGVQADIDLMSLFRCLGHLLALILRKKVSRAVLMLELMELANGNVPPDQSLLFLSIPGIYHSLYRVYGHTQEFVSFDFYENMIRHAIGKNLFDSTLEREPW